MAKPPKPYGKDQLNVGMTVQDGSANRGTIKAFVKWEKKDKPPNNDSGTYAVVQFEEALEGSYFRYNGTWPGNGQKVVDCPTGTAEFIKANDKKLWPDMNEASVKELRAKYGDKVAHMSDTLLIKFCVARKFDMKEVCKMLDANLKWVEEFKPTCDVFLDPKFGEFYPVGFIDGTDRAGNLLYFERPGNGGLYHPKKFVSTFGIEKICQWHICGMEEGRKRLREHPTAKRVTAIIDLTKLGDCDMSVVKFGKAIGAIDQNNYPEHLSNMFMINASGFFTGIWRIMRAFIDERTKAKIQILGPNYMEILKQYIDVKHIPDFVPGGEDVSWKKRGGVIGSEDPEKAKEAESGLKMEEVATPKESDADAASPKEEASPNGESEPSSPTTTDKKEGEEKKEDGDENKEEDKKEE